MFRPIRNMVRAAGLLGLVDESEFWHALIFVCSARGVVIALRQHQGLTEVVSCATIFLMMLDLRSVLARRGMNLADFARKAGVNKSTVTRWAQKQVPAESIVAIEAATGVPRHELRPDLFAAREGRAA